MMRLGLVGLPNAGKSTLFNALTAAGAVVAGYPFTTVDRNVGSVGVPDRRLERLGEVLQPPRVTPAVVELVDIAGLVRGASRGEGLGNRFLAHIREMDALVHVVRCHGAGDVAHVEGGVDPVRDLEVVEAELLLADLETVDRRREDAARRAKSGRREARDEVQALDALRESLAGGTPARRVDPQRAPSALRDELFLLTDKPVLLVANVDEEAAAAPGDNPHVRALRAAAERRGDPVLAVSALLEAELAELPPAEARAFRGELGPEEGGLEALIRAGYRSLGLLTFFTANENELRARPLRDGRTAWHAAGEVHTDMQRGFVRAEVIDWERLYSLGGFAAAREQGVLRIEGRDYRVRDGDLITFRFTV